MQLALFGCYLSTYSKSCLSKTQRGKTMTQMYQLMITLIRCKGNIVEFRKYSFKWWSIFMVTKTKNSRCRYSLLL